MEIQKMKIFEMVFDDTKDVEIDGKSKDVNDLNNSGVYRWTQTGNPAYPTKGFAFEGSSVEIFDQKQFYFSDDVQMVIASAVIMPNILIERKEKGETYFVYMTEETSKKAYLHFMRNLKTTKFINRNHTETMVDAHLKEIMLVDTVHKQKYIKEAFNKDVPLYTWFSERQYLNKEDFSEAVLKDETGISIEGIFEVIDRTNDEKQIKEKKFEKEVQMKKEIIENVFYTFSSFDVDADVINFESPESKVNMSFNKEGKVYVIEDSKITKIEAEEEKEKEKEEDIEKMKEEVKADSKIEDDIEDDIENAAHKAGITEDDVIRIIKPELDKLYEALATLNANANQKAVEFNAVNQPVKPKSKIEMISNSLKISERKEK